MRVWVGGHNVAARAEIEKHLAGTVRPATGGIDYGFLTPLSVDEAVYFARKLVRRLSTGGCLWVVYPKPTSPRAKEFDGTGESLITALGAAGLTAGSRLAVSDDYVSESVFFRE